MLKQVSNREGVLTKATEPGEVWEVGEGTVLEGFLFFIFIIIFKHNQEMYSLM